MLGLAKRAGKIISGESGCKDSIRFGSSYLIIIAEDTGVNTKKSITDSCKFYDVPYYEIGNIVDNGRAIGNSFNAVLSVTDEGFAKVIEKSILVKINGGE
jgi:ribosomal protein L7Ae-like RNA K-turn-binding protein